MGLRKKLLHFILGVVGVGAFYYFAVKGYAATDLPGVQLTLLPIILSSPLWLGIIYSAASRKFPYFAFGMLMTFCTFLLAITQIIIESIIHPTFLFPPM